MKLKKYFGQAVLIASLVVAFTMSVEAKTEILGRSVGKWNGGIRGKQVYSEIQDTKRDNLRLHGTVYVRNDMGQTSKKTGYTKGVGKKFYVTRSATYKNVFIPNKAWYSGFRTTNAKGN